MKVLLGILNSKLFYFWLFFKGKRKGNILELFGTPLSEIPLKIFDNKINKEIKLLSDKIINSKLGANSEYINKIDDIIFKAYELTEKEINFIDNFYTQKITLLK